MFKYKIMNLIFATLNMLIWTVLIFLVANIFFGTIYSLAITGLFGILFCLVILILWQWLAKMMIIY